MIKSKILKKLGIEKEFKIELEDKIVYVKCNVTELLMTKDPDKACEIVRVIPKQTSNKENKQKD